MNTRKIEGWIGDSSEQWLKDNFNGAILFRKTEGVGELRATLIIGGKGYTYEEVKAFIADLKDQTMSIAVEQSIDRIAAKHGITLP